MGVYRVDGGRGLTSNAVPSNKPLSSSRPATFAQALQNARTATENASKSSDPQLLALAQANWAIVQDWEENDYRIAALSSDPKTAIANLDAKFGELVPDNGNQKKIFEQITAGAKKTVEGESPAERQFQLDLYNKQSKVAETYDALQNASPNDSNAAFTNYTTAVKDLIDFQLRHELAKLPAGPNGSHTLAQWQQAADAIKALPGTTAESAQVIDKMAQVSGYLDQIEHNRASLKLTQAEQDLATNNPVMLAFVKAAGVTIDLEDPKLSPEMKQIAKSDPRMFVILTLSGVSISTDGTPVVKDSSIGHLANGKYLHVTVGGKEIVDANLLNGMVAIYNNLDESVRNLKMGEVLIPLLHLEDNMALQALVIASDHARTQYGVTQMKALTSGPNPDGKAILAFMSTQLTGYFDAGARKAFWEANGKPHITQDYFRKQFEQLLKKPDPRSTDPKDIRELQSTETNADKIGRYMQGVLAEAPAEVADVLLDTVKSSYHRNWEHANKVDSSGLTSRYEEFYKALSMAVELSPGRAQEITDWLMDRSGPQGVALIILWDPQLRRFEGLKDTITEGYGLTLSQTLLESVKKNRDYNNMEFDLDLRVNQGIAEINKKYASKVNKENYKAVMDDLDKHLQPFFQSFLNDKNIGNPVAIQNETQLHNMIGKVLGFAPTDTEAAAKLDYTKEWYSPNTAEWTTIVLVTDMVNHQVAELKKSHGNRDYTINALPGKYISERDGPQTLGLILIEMPGIGAQELIDPSIAFNAVDVNGDKKLGVDEVHGKWHFDNLKHFQDDNAYDDDGKLYLPTNLRLGDSDNDGKISSADYKENAAAITTGMERAQTYTLTGLAVVGVAATIFIPGVNVIVVGALVTAGAAGLLISGIELGKVYNTGAGWSSLKWSNPEARMQWMNVIGTVLAGGRFAMLRSIGPASKFVAAKQLAASTMGAGSTYIGVNLMAMQSLHLAQTWDDPGNSWWDKTVSIAGISSGAAMIGLSAMPVRPVRAASNPVKDYGGTRVASARLTGAYAFKKWLADKMPGGGIVAEFWKTAHTKFETAKGKLAYQQWVDKGRPTDEYFNEALKFYKPRIETEAQTLAGTGKPTEAHRIGAQDLLAQEIGLKAYEFWTASTSKKNGATTALWSKALRTYNRETSWSGYQLWRAEQGFIKQIGKDAYDAHLASVKAGNAPEAWWTDAIAKYRTQIDDQAKQLWRADPDASKPAWNDPVYLTKAEAKFAHDLGFEAYRIWSASHGSNRAANTPLTKLDYSAKAWANAGSPKRVTTDKDDIVLWSETQRMFRTGSLKIGSKTIGPVRFWLGRDPVMIKQAKTDITVWTGAERILKIRIGKKKYEAWSGTLKKTVGAEDKYFQAANTHYATEIAAKAHKYFEDPSQLVKSPLGTGRTLRVDRGATGEFWTKNQAEFKAQLKQAEEAWVRDGQPRADAEWSGAIADMKGQIDSKAQALWQTAFDNKTLAGRTVDQFVPAAETALAKDITYIAYARWLANPPTWSKSASHWTVAKAKTDESTGAAAYKTWADAGFPDGRRNAAWVVARRDVVGSGSYAARRAGQWGKDLWLQSWIKTGDRGGAFNTIGWKQGFLQMGRLGKWYGLAWGVTNLFGAAGWVVTNFLVRDNRTSGAIPDANAAEIELRKLLDNPENYVSDNYKSGIDFTVPVVNSHVSVPLGDWSSQADGHVMAFITPDGNIEYFHRIPDDLYQKLNANAKSTGVKPWILDLRTNQDAKTQVFKDQDGRLYVYEIIKLDESGNYPFSEGDLLKADPQAIDELPDEIKEQIGVRAYWSWVQNGRPQGTAGAALWSQAEIDFRAQTGQQAYDAWVVGGKPKAGDNVYWDGGVRAHQKQIDTEAQALWNADTDPNKSANFSVAKYLDPAEKKYGADIAMSAYTRWNQDGRKPGTLGVQQWNAGEPNFQKKLGLPAFDAWVGANKSPNGDNAAWAAAVKEWDDAGKPIMQKVEIRGPWRTDEHNEVRKVHTEEEANNLLGDGRRHRFNWGVGPIEGWRMHANFEATWNYRYNIPTTTTFRTGLPSPTQGWSWDVRQQDTTMWNRLNLSVGTIEINGAQVYDLTENSRNGWTVMNNRFYVDMGNRNRIRLDATGKYLRFRETGFLEIGVGADFFKRTTAEGTLNVNGYFELQFYAPDFRSQVNVTNKDNRIGFNNTRGFEAFPLLGIDPAFQVSWSSNKKVPRLADIPVISSDNS